MLVPAFWSATWSATQDPPQPRPALPVPMIFEESPRTRWEYRVVVVDLREQEPLGEAELAEMGTDGWLLASVLEWARERPPGRVFYYFVRTA